MLASRTIFLSLLLTGAAAMAQAPVHNPGVKGAEQAALEERADLAFGQAVGGDKGAVNPAAEAYGQLLALDPARGLYHVRLGSLSAMQGRDAAEPEARLALVQKGLTSMGRAVALAPNDFTIRLTRATTCLALPPFFHQADTAIQDCLHLEGLLAQDPQRYPLDLRMRTKLLLATGLKQAGRGGEAKAVLEQVLAEAPGTPHAQRAAELLK